MWCIPTVDSTYQKRMRNILKLYCRPHDPLNPVVCLDEKSIQLIEDKYPHHRTRRGVRLKDYEYVRKGTANVFVITTPKGRQHYGRVTQRRTAADFARTMKWLAARYPKAQRIHLVMDNLNTHFLKSLTETFGDREGRNLWKRFRIYYTPKHASWLNQAEIAISVMTRSVVGKRRISDIRVLRTEVTRFWQHKRRSRWSIDWRFTNRKATKWLKTYSLRH